MLMIYKMSEWTVICQWSIEHCQRVLIFIHNIEKNLLFQSQLNTYIYILPFQFSVGHFKKNLNMYSITVKVFERFYIIKTLKKNHVI